MSEIISINLRVDENLARELKKLADNYDLDNDIIDLTPQNINLFMQVAEAKKLGFTICDLIGMLCFIKEKTQTVNN